MTKEQLAREIADWTKRAQHEAKLAFAKGDLWSALAWGAKVPDLAALARCVRIAHFDSSPEIDALEERLGEIVRAIDVQKRIATMLGRAGCTQIGVDLGLGFSATALAVFMASEVDRLGRRTTLIDQCVVPPSSADEVAFKEQCREKVKRHVYGGKSVDLTIIDDSSDEHW